MRRHLEILTGIAAAGAISAGVIAGVAGGEAPRADAVLEGTGSCPEGSTNPNTLEVTVGRMAASNKLMLERYVQQVDGEGNPILGQDGNPLLKLELTATDDVTPLDIDRFTVTVNDAEGDVLGEGVLETPEITEEAPLRNTPFKGVLRIALDGTDQPATFTVTEAERQGLTIGEDGEIDWTEANWSETFPVSEGEACDEPDKSTTTSEPDKSTTTSEPDKSTTTGAFPESK